jgi:hypothetical protein
MFPQASQASLESVREVDVLARLEPKGHLGIPVEQEWNDRLVMF